MTLDGLSKSILGTVLCFLAAQFAIFSAFAIAAGFGTREWLPFFPASLLMHIALVFVLWSLKADFVAEPEGKRFERVNAANKITLARLSTLPTILFLVLASKEHKIEIGLLSLIALVFVSDFLDGYVSRKAKEVTRAGRILDSISDYGLLVVLSIVFYYFNLVPGWLMATALARFFLQGVLQVLILMLRGRIRPVTTPLGKAAVAAVMFLYAAEIVELLTPVSWAPLYFGIEIAAAAILVVSAADKVYFFVREINGKNEADSIQL